MRREPLIIRPCVVLALCCLLATAGCAAVWPFGQEAPDAGRTPPAAARPAQAAPSPAGTAAAAAAVQQAEKPPAQDAVAGPKPDAVIKLSPGSRKLSQEMEARLAAVAARAREDDRIVVRLESYVPGGGSPSLNLLRAEQTLQLVKQRLLELDVNPRRILTAPFGGEYDEARDERRHWVEIYLVLPRL
ncbi:MAG TPA: hypothetical protein PKC23_03075 [Candidatus Desulfobacillus sp.]|nr:hypothetical protein [Candidatus Desulfobacillus sp.]